MTHINPVLRTLLEEMVNYPTRDNVLPKYQIVLHKIRDLFHEIKKCKKEEEASHYFDQLQEIQSYLAILVFKENIDEYKRINKFVSDFDRIDDFRMRQYMFNAIKFKKYTL